MDARYFQEGKSLDYTPSSPVSAGDVIALQNNHYGVAKLDIAQNTPGALAVDGVFVVAKPAESITFGALLFWNSGTKQAQLTPIANAYIGRAACAAADTDTTVLLALNAGNIGTVTVTVPTAQSEPSPTQEAIGALTAKAPEAITAVAPTVTGPTVDGIVGTDYSAEAAAIAAAIGQNATDLAAVKAELDKDLADLADVRAEVVNAVADLATIKASVNAGKADLAALVALLVTAGILE